MPKEFIKGDFSTYKRTELPPAGREVMLSDSGDLNSALAEELFSNRVTIPQGEQPVVDLYEGRGDQTLPESHEFTTRRSEHEFGKVIFGSSKRTKSKA